MTRSRESGVVGGGEGTAGTGEEGRIGRGKNSGRRDRVGK